VGQFRIQDASFRDWSHVPQLQQKIEIGFGIPVLPDPRAIGVGPNNVDVRSETIDQLLGYFSNARIHWVAPSRATAIGVPFWQPYLTRTSKSIFAPLQPSLWYTGLAV